MRSDPGKRCSRCRQVLALDAFAVRRASPDGRQSICRACSAEYARQTRPRTMTAPPTVPAGKKWCRRCETVKDLDDFAAHRASKDKRQTYCRACYAEIYRDRRVQQGHVVRPAEVPAGHKFCRSCQQVKPLADWATGRTEGTVITSAAWSASVVGIGNVTWPRRTGSRSRTSTNCLPGRTASV